MSYQNYVFIYVHKIIIIWLPLLISNPILLQVRSAVDRGDYTAAQTASKTALQFNKLAIIIGIIILVFVLVLVGLSQLSWIIPLAIIRSN